MINPSTNKELKQIRFDEVNWDVKSPTLKQLAKVLLNNGFKIIGTETNNMRNGVENISTTFFSFTKDQNYYAYAQQVDTSFGEFELGTIHEGHKKHGGGTIVFHTFEKITDENLLFFANYALQKSKEECDRFGLKPLGKRRFTILDYKEVIL